MNASTQTIRRRNSRTLLQALAKAFPSARSSARPVIAALLAVFAAAGASAQQVTNPGDIIVIRTVTPRDAFVPVPKDQDPVAVRATTFPANTFNPAIAQLVGDTDLTNAHGSSGVAIDGSTGGGMQAVTQILSGRSTGNTIALNSGTIGQPAAGIGGTLSSSITGSLAPLSSALSGSLGGLK